MNPPSTFKCQYCDKEFSKKSNWTRHTKTVHKRNSSGDLILDNPREIFTCELCDKNFAAKRNLKRHINVVHLLHCNTKKYKCSRCRFETVYQSNLKRHFFKTHEKNEAITETCLTLYFKCSKCTAKFKKERNLKYHQRKIHRNGEVTFPTKRKCPMCPYVSVQQNKDDIHTHFEKIHDIPVRQNYYNFDSIEEFHSWKNEIEKTTATSYIKRFSTEATAYYHCHRCGYHKSRGHTKRNMKISGSCKINGFCPAKIAMKLKHNKVRVLYVSTHVGHKNDLKHIRLSREEKKSIALQLASKKPHEEILKSIRGSLSNFDLQRIHLTNKKDIVNI